MGRPVKYSPGEVRGLAERARYMASVAEGALADHRGRAKARLQPGSSGTSRSELSSSSRRGTTRI